MSEPTHIGDILPDILSRIVMASAITLQTGKPVDVFDIAPEDVLDCEICHARAIEKEK